ncbi:Uncharacterised protein [Mycobacteroides abscessus subsp. abscessus]|nr:Uncharacterised protein [Mycobacteroides abscessus subsp. abscessus]
MVFGPGRGSSLKKPCTHSPVTGFGSLGNRCSSGSES